jgi:isoleucyl-tRNA synthetase
VTDKFKDDLNLEIQVPGEQTKRKLVLNGANIGAHLLDPLNPSRTTSFGASVLSGYAPSILKHLLNAILETQDEKIKPNFKALGSKVGKDMKLVSAKINALSMEEVAKLERDGEIMLADTPYTIQLTDVEIIAEDVAGWQVANLAKLTVALDIHISDELRQEGLSRELVNRIQNLRKDKGFEVTDRIVVFVSKDADIEQATNKNLSYICTEILADSLRFEESLTTGDNIDIDGKELNVLIEKI